VSTSLWWRLQAIADATDGGQQFDYKRGVDFPPQAANVHINHIRFAFEVIVPDMLLDHLARDYLVRMVHEVFKQRELLWCEIDELSSTLNAVGDRIDHQVFHFQPSCFIGLLATQQRAQACQQFTHGKRLHQVIVGATIKALAFFPEFFTEDELAHKFDEGVLLLLAIGAITWYLVGKNKFSRTIVPILFTAAALVMKLIAFFLLEKGDAADLGDEFGVIILFVITLAFLIWQYVSIKRMAQLAEKETGEVSMSETTPRR
jgi:hypothetical protein